MKNILLPAAIALLITIIVCKCMKETSLYENGSHKKKEGYCSACVGN